MMYRTLRLIVVVLFLAQSPLASFSQSKWTEVQSAKFRLVGNAAEKNIRRVATKLEQFREVFARLFPSLNYDSPVPTTVIVFRDERSFRPFKPLGPDGKPAEWIAGYFRASDDSNYIVLSTEQERQQTFQTIYHEYVHYLINNSFGRSRIPAWFNEGIAEYYDQFEMDGDLTVRLGALNQNHLRLLQHNKLLPLEQLFRIDYAALHGQGSHGASIFYAQAWAMMHMLINGKPVSRGDNLRAFIEAVGRGEEQTAAFKRAFGTDYAGMEAELRQYVAQQTLTVRRLTFKEKLVVDEQIVSVPLAEAEAKAVLGDLLLGSRRLDEAEEHLMAALAASPESIGANSSMGMLLVRKGRFAEARKHLEKAKAMPGATFLEHYRFAYLLSREPMGANGWVSHYSDGTAAAIRASLKTAISMNPRFPESYRVLAFVSIVRSDQVDESIAHIRRAMVIAPTNEAYRLDLASLLARKDDFAAARKLVDDVLRSTQESSIREHAVNVANNIEYLERNRAVARALSESRARDGGIPQIKEHTDPPPTEEKLRELQRTAELAGLNASLRAVELGEMQIVGHVSRIECGRGYVLFTIKSSTGTLRLQSDGFEKLYLKTFRPIEDKQIGCVPMRSEYFAVITYRPETDTKLGTSGRLVAIEIVPDYFEFREK